MSSFDDISIECYEEYLALSKYLSDLKEGNTKDKKTVNKKLKSLEKKVSRMAKITKKMQDDDKTIQHHKSIISQFRSDAYENQLQLPVKYKHAHQCSIL